MVTWRAEGRSDKGWMRAVRGPQAAPPTPERRVQASRERPRSQEQKGGGAAAQKSASGCVRKNLSIPAVGCYSAVKRNEALILSATTPMNLQNTVLSEEARHSGTKHCAGPPHACAEEANRGRKSRLAGARGGGGGDKTVWGPGSDGGCTELGMY